MSGILGVFGPTGSHLDLNQVQRMAARQGWRGDASTQLVSDGAAALVASRHEWELTNEHSGNICVLEDSRFLVAADACIYYRRDLRGRLTAAGVSASGETATHYVFDAYRAWGDKCPEYLEGVFAFIVFDRKTRSVFCARDFSARRSLCFAILTDTLVVGSSVGAVLAHSDCPQTLDLGAVGAIAAGWQVAYGPDTCYEAVRVVPAGGALAWLGGKVRVWRYWSPPPVDSTKASSFDDGAAELRHLLACAVSERMAPDGTTAVSMSGGRDSTAVFAAGQLALSTHQRDQNTLRPVSISYPEGDLGREDDFIRAVAERWGVPVHWLFVDDIQMLSGDAERAAMRDEPGASPYENWNVALAHGARACGARILLDGDGGDQLFRTMDIYLADLLRTGQWIELTKELWAKRRLGRRHLFEMTVLPLLPNSSVALLNRFQRGAQFQHYLQFPLPPWLRSAFVERHDLVGRQLAFLPPRCSSQHEAGLLQWYFTSAIFDHAHRILQRRLLEAGVDSRGPLMDERLVKFAFGRPRAERLSGLDDKRLLRASMRGLIPDSVLAPRERRTGITISYSRRSMKRDLPELFKALFRSPLMLAELGVIDTDQLKSSLERYEQRNVPDFTRMAFFHTLQTELWLRSRARRPSRL
jgi:asparagine synthase (glutamine-hydrolysing)